MGKYPQRFCIRAGVYFFGNRNKRVFNKATVKGSGINLDVTGIDTCGVTLGQQSSQTATILRSKKSRGMSGAWLENGDVLPRALTKIVLMLLLNPYSA